MIMQCASAGNENQDEEYREIWLGPYLGNRAVTDDQINAALASGLTIDEIHDRLLDAECLLFESYDHAAWEQGWRDAVDAIQWLDSDENRRVEDTELFYGDLRELADDRRQELRRECYASALTTGSPVLNVLAYSNKIGRCDCLTAGMLFVQDEGNDWSEIASVLRKTNDRKELREMANRRREDDYVASLSRLPGLINVLGILRTIGGAK